MRIGPQDSNRQIQGTSNFGSDARGEREARNESLREGSSGQPPRGPSGHGPANQDPTPQYVYWIRRALALVIVIAVLSLLAWGISALVGLFNTEDPATNKDTDSSAPASADKDSGTQAEPKNENSPKSCDPAAVDMVLGSERSSVTVGASMPFVLEVTNDGDKDCIMDVSPSQTPITIYSGEDRIWSSSDCDDSGTKALFMEQKAKTSSGANWNGERSDSSCSNGLPKVKAGTYRAVAEYKKASSNELVFQVK